MIKTTFLDFPSSSCRGYNFLCMGWEMCANHLAANDPIVPRASNISVKRLLVLLPRHSVFGFLRLFFGRRTKELHEWASSGLL